MIDRSKFINSEWEDEPARQEFVYNGYHCIIVRHPELLHLCGYVGVLQGHICYEKHHDTIPYDDLLPLCVHGGLTFSGLGDSRYLPMGFWWLGFDCAHFRDYVPAIDHIVNEIEKIPGNSDLSTSLRTQIAPPFTNTYRNISYVRKHTESLADQIDKLGFIDWEFTWVWPFFLPVKAAWHLWKKHVNAGRHHQN